MEEKDYEGCCKDEHKHFKLKADHQKTAVAAMLLNITAPALITPDIDVYFQAFLQVIESYSSCHAPPDIARKRLQVLHCVFLI